MIGFEGLVVFSRQNNSVELACFFNKNRFALGLSGKATESVLGFCGCDTHIDLPK